ncbi:hypothetical protein D3C85_1566430 [compost metagenome]
MHILDVATRTEGAAIAGEHHDPHRRVATYLGTKVDKLLNLLGRRQGVAGFGMVHAHGDNTAIALNLKKLTHTGSLTSRVNDCWP